MRQYVNHPDCRCAGRHSAAALLAAALSGLADAALLLGSAVFRADLGILRIGLAGGSIVTALRGAAGRREWGHLGQGVRCPSRTEAVALINSEP